MATQPPDPNQPARPPRGQRRHGDWYGSPGGGLFLAVALIVLGAYFLLRNLGVFSWLRDDIFWPAVLIALGIALLLRRNYWRR